MRRAALSILRSNLRRKVSCERSERNFSTLDLASGDHTLPVHIRADGGGNVDRAIGALIVLHHGNERAADGKPGTIQRMYEFRLPLRVAKARLHPSCLKRLAIRAR